MKYVMTILLLMTTFTVFSQNQSLPVLKMYKSDKSVITTPLTDIDSLVHVSLVPVNLTLLDIKNITNTSATFEAKILSRGVGTLGQIGFCWSTTQNPTISANKVKGSWKDSNNFLNTIYSLTKNTKYYVRAYAYNEFGISYSNQIEFSTLNKEDSLLESVKIGTQIWTSRNLEVSTYRNGEPIRLALSPEEWLDAARKGEGAWCYYNYDPKNGEIYGKLYNWFCVKDSRGLAPSGYHIPSDLEWSLLSEYLGGEEIAGFKMKSTSGWSNGGNGDNSSGFNALPGGVCFYDGNFCNIPDYGFWWSSSENDTYFAWDRYLNNSYTKVFRNDNNKKCGFSVRCLRD
jgi:uncharacterized protein (TIGR02145 family)